MRVLGRICNGVQAGLSVRESLREAIRLSREYKTKSRATEKRMDSSREAGEVDNAGIFAQTDFPEPTITRPKNARRIIPGVTQ